MTAAVHCANDDEDDDDGVRGHLLMRFASRRFADNVIGVNNHCELREHALAASIG